MQNKACQSLPSKPVTQSKSKTQSQEVCIVSSIVILLTLIGHNMIFISIRISLDFDYTNKIIIIIIILVNKVEPKMLL